MNTALFAICLLVLACPLLAWLAWACRRNRIAKRNRQERFRTRPDLGVDEWYSVYFRPMGLRYDASIAIAQKFAEVFDCKPSQFYPGDAFDMEFKFKGVHILGIGSDDEMESLCEEVIPSILSEPGAFAMAEGETGALETFGDLVRWCEPYLVTGGSEQ